MYYTIKISKAGINQYLDIHFDKDGNLKTKELKIRYTQDVLSLENFSTIDEIINFLKSYSYNKTAIIWKIDGLEPNFYKKSEIYNNEIKEVNYAMQVIFRDFYDTNILPLLPSEDYEKDIFKHDNYTEINFLCYKLLYSLGFEKSNSFDSETNYNGDYFFTVQRKAGL